MTKFIIAFAFISACFVSMTQQKKSIKLEKIIYHTSTCFGTCPAYHLEIDKNRHVKLYAQIVFKSTGRIIDSAQTGYFKGKLSTADYSRLVMEIQAAGIDTLSFPNVMCCDGVVTTLIVHYNGKRKYLKSMLPPAQSKNLTDYLFSICERKDLVRTKEKFKIEE